MADLEKSDVSISLSGRDVKISAGPRMLSLPTITFGDGSKTYPAGGVPLPDKGHFGLKKELQRMFIQQPAANGFFYKYDSANHKILVLHAGLTANAGKTVAVAHAATPGGNAIHLKFLSDGTPYLCCNMATDTADKVISLGGYKVVITHDASAGDGLQVYFDEDGAAGAQLIVNNTITGVAAYVPTDTPGYFLVIANDGSASSNGVAVNYDDGSDEQLEATFAGEADVDLVLSAYAAGELVEIPATATPAEVSLPALVVGE